MKSPKDGKLKKQGKKNIDLIERAKRKDEKSKVKNIHAHPLLQPKAKGLSRVKSSTALLGKKQNKY